MNWFVWRQHRKQFLIFGILLAGFAALLIPTGIHYWNAYQRALTTCAQNPVTLGCNDLADTLFTSQLDGFTKIAVVLGTFGLPILVGLFIGSPLLAREYEEGTNKLAWTQSTSRRRWLTTKMGWALGFALLYGTALTLLVTWWSRTPNVLAHARFVQGHFETQGIMPVAYSVFFTAIGFMSGALFRKTLIGFGITLAIFAICMGSFAQWLRPHYMTPVTVTAPMGAGAIDAKIPTDAWVLRRNIVDGNGHVFDSFRMQEMPPQCLEFTQRIQVANNGHVAKLKAEGIDPLDDCLNQAGYHEVAAYQPGYRYWDFQRIEAGIYLGMTAIAVGVTYWLVLRRDA